ncbi:hypothetical protein HPB48_016059 [Haemaphysalis longicornis]|uniref:Monocarboxylate transporter n=1 Tax=Haemaphysalis longicornis TaxID=44386 RepID=A0A9J6GQ05_HAELO|nr:hypothetical protein HPB48_016059 [Haemaphysalis longicornis]
MAASETVKTTHSKKAPSTEPRVDRCWYVAITCALVTFLTSATIRSSGFLYIGIMREFDVDRGQAAWPICLMGAMANIAGEFSEDETLRQYGIDELKPYARR